MKKRKLIAAFLTVLLPFNSFSTCIVIYIVPGGIAAAADSLSTLQDFHGQSKGSVIIQKIFVKDGMGYAIAGHLDQLLNQQAEASIVPGRSPKVCADSFGIRMKDLYTHWMMLEKKNNPVDYQYYLKNALAEVAFFQYKGSNVSLVAIDIILKELKGRTVIADSVRETSALFLGISDHLVKLSRADMGQRASRFLNRPELFCADLVQLEISNHPGHVSCPIKTFTWNADGYHWGEAACH